MEDEAMLTSFRELLLSSREELEKKEEEGKEKPVEARNGVGAPHPPVNIMVNPVDRTWEADGSGVDGRHLNVFIPERKLSYQEAILQGEAYFEPTEMEINILGAFNEY